MKFLVAVEKYKSNILKIVIVFATITLYFSLFERFFYSHNRNQLNLTIDIYSMCFLTFIFLSEFFACCLCKSIKSNLPLLSHYTGKGMIYLLLSIIYMAPELEEKSNSRYILLCAGILCLLGDIKYDKEDKKTEVKQDNIQIEAKQIPSEEKNETTNESKIITNVLNNTIDLEMSKRTCNPYEYPEDF